MFQLIKADTKIDFMGARHLWVGLSIVAIVASIALFFVKGLNYGIDFTGGAEIRLKFAQMEIGKLREVLTKGGLKEPHVLQVGEPTSGEFLVRVQGDAKSLNETQSRVDAMLKGNPEAGSFEMTGVEVVGPAAGSTLRKSGFLSMFYALLAILIYVAIRFDGRYAPGAVVALFHDTMIVVGIFILTQKQFDLTILAALLALIGYSNNDTIIVFDRVRETVSLFPNLTIEKAVNQAINETLGRTILTSLMTFIVALALFLFGGAVIENFAFTFMIGIIVGTYSSIFIASSLVVFFTNFSHKREAKARLSTSQSGSKNGANRKPAKSGA